MKIILFAALIASPLAVQAQNGSGTIAYRAADVALNAQYRATMAQMARNDAGRSADLQKGFVQPDGAPTYQAALLASQRAWLSYRNAQCSLAAFEFRGGSGESLAKGQCLTDQTRRRTAELKQMQQSFAPK